MNTSRCAIHTFMLLLLHYPDVQDKLQAEIDGVIGRERAPCLQDRYQMPYTEATMLELQRFISIAPLSVPHCSSEDTVFNGYVVPKGFMVLMLLYYN
jgi:cytochrome P450